MEFVGNHRESSIALRYVKSRLEPNFINICPSKYGVGRRNQSKMFTSLTAFLAVSVLFQAAKYSLGKLWLCIIDSQCERIADFHEKIAFVVQDIPR